MAYMVYQIFVRTSFIHLLCSLTYDFICLQSLYVHPDRYLLHIFKIKICLCVFGSKGSTGCIGQRYTLVIVLIRSIHYDPSVWEDPEVFNPERYVACSGMWLKMNDYSAIAMCLLHSTWFGRMYVRTLMYTIHSWREGQASSLCLHALRVEWSGVYYSIVYSMV